MAIGSMARIISRTKKKASPADRVDKPVAAPDVPAYFGNLDS